MSIPSTSLPRLRPVVLQVPKLTWALYFLQSFLPEDPGLGFFSGFFSEVRYRFLQTSLLGMLQEFFVGLLQGFLTKYRPGFLPIFFCGFVLEILQRFPTGFFSRSGFTGDLLVFLYGYCGIWTTGISDRRLFKGWLPPFYLTVPNTVIFYVLFFCSLTSGRKQHALDVVFASHRTHTLYSCL